MTAEQTWLGAGWMQTFTGRQFFPTAPRGEDLAIEDIAHALSLICRYGGHVHRFYSVAEHCVHLSYAVEPEHALWALMHDSTEAYVGDMVRPLKQSMPAYRQVEDHLMTVIAEHFGLPGVVIPQAVVDVDTRILLDERAALMPNTHYPWDIETLAPLGVDIQAWTPTVAERAYIERFDELSGGRS